MCGSDKNVKHIQIKIRKNLCMAIFITKCIQFDENYSFRYEIKHTKGTN